MREGLGIPHEISVKNWPSNLPASSVHLFLLANGLQPASVVNDLSYLLHKSLPVAFFVIHGHQVRRTFQSWFLCQAQSLPRFPSGRHQNHQNLHCHIHISYHNDLALPGWHQLLFPPWNACTRDIQKQFGVYLHHNLSRFYLYRIVCTSQSPKSQLCHIE